MCIAGSRYAEDDLLPISALQHLLFCERQCALIHLEQLWGENRLTVEGKSQHDRVDTDTTESRGDVRTAFGARLVNRRLGLTGKADAVEFHRGTGEDKAGAILPGVVGRWRPYPVEHKHGRPKEKRCDEVQICAQALCLEEMLNCSVPVGALFYNRPRRRTVVEFDRGLRELTASAAGRLHALMAAGRTPAAVFTPRCKQCSLLEQCRPELGGKQSVAGYMRRMTVE